MVIQFSDKDLTRKREKSESAKKDGEEGPVEGSTTVLFRPVSFALSPLSRFRVKMPDNSMPLRMGELGKDGGGPAANPDASRLMVRQRRRGERRELEMPDEQTLKQRIHNGEALQVAGASLEMTKAQLTEMLRKGAYDLESVDAVINARQIAIPGVDMFVFGPNDLLFSLESYPDPPFKTVDECIRHVVKQMEGTPVSVPH